MWYNCASQKIFYKTLTHLDCILWSSDETPKLYKVFLKEVKLALQKVNLMRKAKGGAWREGRSGLYRGHGTQDSHAECVVPDCILAEMYQPGRVFWGKLGFPNQDSIYFKNPFALCPSDLIIYIDLQVHYLFFHLNPIVSEVNIFCL